MSHRLVRHPGKYTKCRPPGRHFACTRDRILIPDETKSPRRGNSTFESSAARSQQLGALPQGEGAMLEP